MDFLTTKYTLKSDPVSICYCMGQSDIASALKKMIARDWKMYLPMACWINLYDCEWFIILPTEWDPKIYVTRVDHL